MLKNSIGGSNGPEHLGAMHVGLRLCGFDARPSSFVFAPYPLSEYDKTVALLSDHSFAPSATSKLTKCTGGILLTQCTLISHLISVRLHIERNNCELKKAFKDYFKLFIAVPAYMTYVSTQI